MSSLSLQQFNLLSFFPSPALHFASLHFSLLSLFSSSFSSCFTPTMKITNININLKRLFRSKQSRSTSRSDEPSSFSSGTTSSDFSESSSSSSSKQKLKAENGSATPTSVLSSHFSGGDLYYQLVEGFKMMDSDSDGKITREELERLLSRVVAEPPSEEEMRMLLSDVDGDGCISLEEFDSISSALVHPPCHAELRDAFDYFDRNRDGRITADELFGVLSILGDGRCTLEDCRRMISGVDKRGDGFVCFEDFSLMMEQQI